MGKVILPPNGVSLELFQGWPVNIIPIKPYYKDVSTNTLIVDFDGEAYRPDDSGGVHYFQFYIAVYTSHIESSEQNIEKFSAIVGGFSLGRLPSDSDDKVKLLEARELSVGNHGSYTGGLVESQSTTFQTGAYYSPSRKQIVIPLSGSIYDRTVEPTGFLIEQA